MIDKKILNEVYIEEHPATLLKKAYEYMKKNKWLFGIFSIEVAGLVSKVGPNTPVYAEFIKGYLTVNLWAEAIEEDNIYVEKLIKFIEEDYDSYLSRKEANEKGKDINLYPGGGDAISYLYKGIYPVKKDK